MAEPNENLPQHAWDEEETIFTEEDDLHIPHLEIPDEELTTPARTVGLDMLIKAAEEESDD